MSPSPSPRWRQAYDRVEGVVSPAVEQVVRTTGFARVVAAAATSSAATRRGVRALSTRWLHQLNLPAATDVTRMRRELGALDREVRRLALQVEQQRRPEEPNDAQRTATDRPAGTGASRRRAQPAAHPQRGTPGRRSR
ncbi:MAG TPA: hypothetical protein VFP61_03630 [Acidimicrobiales bacterium]|nr:hypothetical protein [Acidimicrobiales bacterium]